MMKTRQRLVAILAAAFIFSGSFPVFAEEADQILEETIGQQENTEMHDEEITDDVSLSEMTTVSGNETESDAEEEMTGAPQPETENAPEEAPSETDLQLPEADFPAPETDSPVSETVPSFHAHLKKAMKAYTVTGTLSDLTPDMARIDTLYSLDGETWHVAFGGDWDLLHVDWNDESDLEYWKSQACLFDLYEPLKSYIAGKIDYIYVKLRITNRNGVSIETQSALIERGGLQPIPEGTERYAVFSSAILVSELDPTSPYRYHRYGRYQLTIPPDATAEDVSALLPDTLPVEVQLLHYPDFAAEGVIDCPVTWKPLTLPQLSPGESVTISDAAEEILVPAGTLIPTSFGIFQLDEPLSLDVPPYTDEMQLVLNVSQEDRKPTGVLWAGKPGLELSFHNKPTGAVSIKAYVLTEGESAWTELSGLSLLEEFNQPSTANSGYALVLRNDQEPYRSYLAATEAKETPTPFFVGLTIEGGIYDGKELVLAWPDSYEELPNIKIGGGGGNEGNAGAGNKDDSTESGQRPNLPQPPDEEQQEQPPQTPGDNHEEQPPSASGSNDNGQKQKTPSGYAKKAVLAIPENQSPSAEESFPDLQGDIGLSRQPDPFSHEPEVSDSGQRPNLSQTTQDAADTSSVETYGSKKQTIERLDNSVPPSLIVEAPEETVSKESTVPLTNAEPAVVQKTRNNNPVPFLPVATIIIASGCIAAAVCKTAGYNLLGWIAGKIRKVLH